MNRSRVDDWAAQIWVEPHRKKPGHWEQALGQFGGCDCVLVIRKQTQDSAIGWLSDQPRNGKRFRLVRIGTAEEIRGRLWDQI